MGGIYICILIAFLLALFLALIFVIIDLTKKNEKLIDKNMVLKEELGFQKRRGDIYKKGCVNG